MNLWYPFTLSHICKMTNTLLKPFNRFDIKRLIFLRCRTCFCQNKEKDVTKRYQRYTCLTSHNFLTFEPISKILFVFSFRYIALSNSCIRYQFGQANKNSFALLQSIHFKTYNNIWQKSKNWICFCNPKFTNNSIPTCISFTILNQWEETLSHHEIHAPNIQWIEPIYSVVWYLRRAILVKIKCQYYVFKYCRHDYLYMYNDLLLIYLLLAFADQYVIKKNGWAPRKTTWHARRQNFACLTCDPNEAVKSQDFKFYPSIKLTNKMFPHMVSC